MHDKFLNTLDWYSELPDVALSAKVSVKTLKSEIHELKKGLNLIKVELEQSKPEEKFHQVMTVSTSETPPTQNSYQKSQEFYEKAELRVDSVDSSISGMQTKYKEVMNYYGQDDFNAEAPEEFFKIIDDFKVMLEKTHEELRKEREVRKVPTRIAKNKSSTVFSQITQETKDL